MLKKILMALAIVIAILVIVIMTRPAAYQVERSVTVSAPATVVYAEVSDLKRWAGWSPWESRDPNMSKEYTGTPGTVGHGQTWSGNSDVGSGKMTFTAVTPNERIALSLEFIEPFASVASTAFQFKARDGGCLVTWSMSGENDFMGKAFSLFMNMDDMIGADYEQGLASLKKIAEARK